MEKKQRKYINKFDKHPIWKLPYKLSNVEHKLYILVRFGEDIRKNTKFQKLVKHRNQLRQALRRILIKWNKNRGSNEFILTYYDILENEKYEKYEREDEV